MSSTRSRPVAATAIAVACFVFVAGFEIAGAHEWSAATNATIDSGGPDGAQGKVKSRRARCKRNRRVKLYKEMEGADELFGTTRSDDAGNWNIVASLTAGQYYVLVVRVLAAGGDHVCRLGRSPVKQL